ncbi:MAG: hypothetical protein AAGK21_11170 [Bacteroidota bacterium]
MATSPSKNTSIQGSMPSALPAASDLSAELLSADDVKARLDAREKDIKYHIEALQHETLTLFDDVNVGGRPLMDRIREQPLLATAATLGVGLLLGGLMGLRARSKRLSARPEDAIDVIRIKLAAVREDAAQRVARGTSVDDAIRQSMRSMPVAYGDATGAGAQAVSSTKQAVDVAVKSAVGFLAKAAADQLVRKYTSHAGTIDALTDD